MEQRSQPFSVAIWRVGNIGSYDHICGHGIGGSNPATCDRSHNDFVKHLAKCLYLW